MSVTVSQLRRNIYQMLGRIIETGQPLEIERKGAKLKITKSKTSSRFRRLPKRDCIKGDPEGLVSIDWSHEWKPIIRPTLIHRATVSSCCQTADGRV